MICAGFHKSGLSITFYWNKFKLNHCELSRLLRTCMLNSLDCPFPFPSPLFSFLFCQTWRYKTKQKWRIEFQQVWPLFIFPKHAILSDQAEVFLSVVMHVHSKGDLISEYILKEMCEISVPQFFNFNNLSNFLKVGPNWKFILRLTHL